MTESSPLNAPSTDTPRPKSRGVVVDPVLVMILNLFGAGCAGYFRIGQKQKGVVTAVAFIALAVTTLCAGSLLLSLITAIDGYLQSEQLRSGKAIGQWTLFRQSVRRSA